MTKKKFIKKNLFLFYIHICKLFVKSKIGIRFAIDIEIKCDIINNKGKSYIGTIQKGVCYEYCKVGG